MLLLLFGDSGSPDKSAALTTAASAVVAGSQSPGSSVPLRT